MTVTDIATQANVDCIRRFYANYGRGDLDAALADFADDIDWAAEAAGDAVPWYGPFRGRDAVPNFFAAIAANVTVSEFEVVTITANADNVIAVVRWTYTVRATGRTVSMYMQHWFRFAGGRIVFFRGSEDTGASARAFAADGCP